MQVWYSLKFQPNCKTVHQMQPNQGSQNTVWKQTPHLFTQFPPDVLILVCDFSHVWVGGRGDRAPVSRYPGAPRTGGKGTSLLDHHTAKPTGSILA